ncbi:hypothetical protein BDV93DRAFT_36852 [Ceratobasidium sp. AG-I]|nr:hypothetical protein BDV93DRAFT_36852 [Ceratobasidium sp. AG-I]
MAQNISSSSRASHRVAPQPQDILVFFDGTGKDGRKRTLGNPTNVWKLYELAQRSATINPNRERKVLYIPGMGSQSNSIKSLLVKIYGASIVKMVAQAYIYISCNYRDGDSICLFGYSRGAFVARKVASLFARLGILKTEKDFMAHWKHLEQPTPWESALDDKVLNQAPVPIKCIGVWDTVGAIYNPIFELQDNVLGVPDDELPKNVEHALHVLAFHENRYRFRVTLFKPNAFTKLKEVWFPGSHSDVGGGAQETEMPKLSLFWMLGEMRPFLHISHNPISYPTINKLKPHDAYHEASWKRLVDYYETRLQSEALKSVSRLHMTVQQVRGCAQRTPKSASHSLLSLHDLKWDFMHCFVPWNQLELDHTREPIETKHRGRAAQLREQIAKPRERVSSLPALTFCTNHPPDISESSVPRSRTMSSRRLDSQQRYAVYISNPPLWFPEASMLPNRVPQFRIPTRH